MASDIATLASWSAWWEAVDVAGVVLVLIGVIGEGLSEWPPRALREWRHITGFGRISWLILVAGLAIELVAQHKKDANDTLIIADLNDQTEHEKTARAQFEAQFSWRVIDDGQTKTLLHELSEAPHTVATEFPSGDSEAQYFSLQLRKIFLHAGSKVDIRSVLAPSLLFNLIVPEPVNETTVLVRHALSAANLQPVENDLPRPGAMMQTDKGKGLISDRRIVGRGKAN
jgi:hypothetical protein